MARKQRRDFRSWNSCHRLGGGVSGSTVYILGTLLSVPMPRQAIEICNELPPSEMTSSHSKDLTPFLSSMSVSSDSRTIATSSPCLTTEETRLKSCTRPKDKIRI